MGEIKKMWMDVRRQGGVEPKYPKALFYPLLIVLLGTLVYSNTLNAPFAFDDDYYIKNSPAISDFRYFSDSTLMERGIFKGKLDQNFRSRRVAEFSFAVNYRLDGLRVTGYHLFNLLLHLINGLLVYWLVILTLRTPFLTVVPGGEQVRDDGLNGALLVALFFVAHPVQTEAVTYISQRFTSMATTFYLLALDLFISWRIASACRVQRIGDDRPIEELIRRAVLYGLSLLSVALAMFTKEIAFTLPLMIILYDSIFFGWKSRRQLLSLLPFLLSLFIIPTTILGGGAKYTDMASLVSALSKPVSGNPILTYLFTQFRVIVTYLRLLLLPINQNIDYDYPRYTSFFQTPVTVSFVILGLLGGIGVYLYRCSVRKKTGIGGWQRLISFGICWFFLTLSLESSFIPLNDLIFEHRLYLPSVGFFLAILGMVEIVRRRFASAHTNGALLLLLVVLGVMAMTTYARNNLWTDPVRLWGDAVRKSPDKLRTHNNLGNLYEAEGRFPEAEKEFLQSLRIDGRRPETHVILGTIYMRQGKVDKAQEYFEQAVRLDPSNSKAQCFIGWALAKKGDYKAAVQAFQKSLQLNPGDAEAARMLASVRQLLDATTVLRKGPEEPVK